MTFHSPFGPYRFLWLPFGLVCSQNVFQYIINKTLEDAEGAVSITNNITLHGCMAEEHHTCLQYLMLISHKCGFVFNAKCDLKAESVLCTFGASIITTEYALIHPRYMPLLICQHQCCQGYTGIPGNGHIPRQIHTTNF